MIARLVLILSLSCLASCASIGATLSALNPLNLLGDDTTETEAVDAADGAEGETFVEVPRAEDGKTDIDTVTSARLDYTPSGVIVRAEGLVPTLGYHSASLRPLYFGAPDANGTLWYEFRVLPPSDPQPEGNEFTRSLTVGHFIPNSRLKSVRAITVTAARNDVSIRLR